MLTDNEINEIRNSIDIVDVISNYVPLIPKGKNYFGVCPFHDDHSPSMSVSKEKQIYTCFSCGATGNVFKFLMDYENIDFRQALKKVAELGGIETNLKDIKISTYNKYEDLYKIYDISKKIYQNNINTKLGEKARKYLLDRDIDNEIIKEFEIGLALNKKDFITKALLKNNYDYKTLTKSGLVTKTDLEYIDTFKDRIMFPLYDTRGNTVGYSGRIYNSKDTSKYVNTKATDIFKKGELLYNYHRVKDECRIKKQVIIVEGFMDCIRLYKIGVKNVVATMGTAVTLNQALLIKKLSKNVILLFDGDKAGLKATIACSNELMNIGITPKIVRLEEDLDPDEYIKKYGKDKFLSKLKNPLNFMDFKMNQLKENKNLENSEDEAKYLKEVIDELNKIDDDILKEVTLKKISEESNLDIEFLRSKIKKSSIKKEIKKNLKNKTEQKLDKYQKAQQYLIYYMLKSEEVIKIYNKKISFMPDQNYRKLARAISAFYKENKYINEADLISYLTINNDTLINTLGQIENLKLKNNYKTDEILDYINVIREYNIKCEYDRLKNLMKKETDPLKKASIGEEIINLKKMEI